jgi:hypothetical protein
MGTLAEGRSVEAEIAECCHALCLCADQENVLRIWKRLGQLTAMRAEEEANLFMRESRNGELSNRTLP